MAEYIEREAILGKLADRRAHTFPEKAMVHTDTVMQTAYKDIMSIPAADVVPVVHGRWDENGRCTNCGGHAPFWSMSSAYYKSPYCHQCGARMDGE